MEFGPERDRHDGFSLVSSRPPDLLYVHRRVPTTMRLASKVNLYAMPKSVSKYHSPFAIRALSSTERR